MRFITVAERELRAAARRKGTYLVRWLTGVGFFGLLIWLMWAFGVFRYNRNVHGLFMTFSILVFFYCLLIGAIRTADCISSERREGTLGLLFLTNLNSAEILAGKLCSNALPSAYGLLAIFPMLALPLLMGGVTGAEFARAMLALVVAILFALGCGFIASVLCRRQFPAVALATSLVLVLGTGTFGMAAALAELYGSNGLVHGLASLSPLYAVAASDGGRIFGANHFWAAIFNVTVISAALLGCATLLLACSWRDRPVTARRTTAPEHARGRIAAEGRQAARAAFKARLMSINPFYWLAARRQASAPVFMLIVGFLVLLTMFVTTPLFVKMVGSQRYNQTLGSMLAWLCTGLAVHLLALYYSAMVSSQAVAEDKQTGGLELIFSTPIQERTILRGLGMAFRRRMAFPALAVFLIHGHAVLLVMSMALLEPPGPVQLHGTPRLELLWTVLLNRPIGGRFVEWEFVMIVRVIVLILPLAVVLWMTLGRIGRWLGLRMKHPGFAPLVALAMLAIPPTLEFTVLCLIADEAHYFGLSDRIWLPWMVGAAFALVLLHCAIVGGWAARRLRENFRHVAIGQIEMLHRSLNDRIQAAAGFALRTMGVAALGLLLLVGYHGCQNHLHRQAWTSFQKKLREQGRSLDLAAVLPPVVPDQDTFTGSREFQDLLARNNPLADALNQLSAFSYQYQIPEFLRWRQQQPASLETLAGWITPGLKPVRSTPPALILPGIQSGPLPDDGSVTNNPVVGPVVLETMQPWRIHLQALAAAARRPALQPATNRTALAVLQPAQNELTILTRLHLMFTLRALAGLECGKADEAGEDMLTCFQLARLARQSPDAASPARVQYLLLDSFQPLWQGLNTRQWSESQLASFQSSLIEFNLLADFTNAVDRVVRANIEIWKSVPQAQPGSPMLPDSNGGYRSSSSWRGMPDSWWLDCCIRLHQTGQLAISGVEANGTQYTSKLDWSALNELPLDGACQSLLQRALPNNYTGTEPQISLGQTALNQAHIAIALELHRLRTGQHPESLKALVPTYLPSVPCDVEVGRAMLYELRPDGSFVLRGLGPNHKDDRRNTFSDDWLWTYPQNAPVSTPPGPGNP